MLQNLVKSISEINSFSEIMKSPVGQMASTLTLQFFFSGPFHCVEHISVHAQMVRYEHEHEDVIKRLFNIILIKSHYKHIESAIRVEILDWTKLHFMKHLRYSSVKWQVSSSFQLFLKA